MKKSIKLFLLLLVLPICSFNVNASGAKADRNEQSKVISNVKAAASHIKKEGIQKAISDFKKSDNIFIGNYAGIFFVSPLHPDQIGKNVFDYKDPSGKLVVQEEINKAKAGGGWLKGRWRENPETNTYQCRKIYLVPVAEKYFVGSWYHYASDKPGVCFK